VTLDPDVATELERIRKAEGRRFKHVLNDALRAGLRQLGGETRATSRGDITRPQDLGEPLVEVSSTSRLLALAEGEEHL
jgi:hypothetical protein